MLEEGSWPKRRTRDFPKIFQNFVVRSSPFLVIYLVYLTSVFLSYFIVVFTPPFNMEFLNSDNQIYRSFRSAFVLTRGTSEFSLFLRFIRGFRDSTVRYRAINYFKFILKKTACMSHIKFLSSCLRIGHIPKGFRLSFHGQGYTRDSLTRDLSRCSFSLMRT